MHKDSVHKIRTVLDKDIDQIERDVEHYLENDEWCHKAGVLNYIRLLRDAVRNATEAMQDKEQ